MITKLTTPQIIENRMREIRFHMHTYFSHQKFSEMSYNKEGTLEKIVYVALVIFYMCLLSYPVDKAKHYGSSLTTSKITKINVEKPWSFLFRFNGIPGTHIQTFPFSINSYANEIVKDNKSPDDLMRYEWARYLSFKTFPLESVMTPIRLSQAGFFYTGRGEEVKCFCCGMINDDWKTGETAIEVHKRLSPNCKFICGENTDNVEIHGREYYNGMFEVTSDPSRARVSRNTSGASGGPADTISRPSGEENNASTEQNVGTRNDNQVRTEPRQTEASGRAQANNVENTASMKHPDYAALEARVASFMTWTQLDIQDPVELAEAGLFYTGVQDFVRCYSCGVGLKNWERGDKPWVEHKRWSNSCRHLLNYSGAQGHSDATPTRGQSDEPGSTGSPEKRNAGASGSGIKEGKNMSTSGTEKHNSNKGSDKNTGASRNADMDSPAVRSLLEMGYSQEQTLEAMQKFRQTNNSQHMTATALVELLESAHSSSEAASTSPSTSSSMPESVMNQSTTKPTSANKENESQNRNLGNCAGGAQSLIEENESLRSQMQCKICMDNDANVVFLPCGHMVACQTCAVSLRKCAICRKLIKGSVKVYQS